MGRRRLSASSLPEAAGAIPDPFPPELRWPFGRLDSLNQNELRESAYEIFFSACRSSTPAGTRPSAAAGGRAGAATTATAGVAKNMAVTSRLKRALGLRARKTRPMVVAGAGGRPMTSAEIMRRQMGVTEQTDGRLRKTLVRCLVGPQMPKKVESLVLPLEFLRHLKPSDFSDASDHRAWQLRQLKVLEAGLVSHPSVPLDRGNPAASSLRETIRSAQLQTRPLDVRALSAGALALSWRSVDVCRWADGYPLNVHLYLSLLRAVFDARDETAVLDEVDELLELIRKTWSVLGLNRMIHDVCFTWLLFEKYVITGQVESDLLSAVLTMLEQVRDDAEKKDDGLLEPWHLRILAATLASMHSWAEDKLLDYHEEFGDHQAAGYSSMVNVVSLATLAATMRGAVIIVVDAGGGGDRSAGSSSSSSVSAGGEQVERYIKSSVRRAFTRLHETGTAGKMDSMIVEVDEDPCETLMYVAAQTKELARVEKEVYSRVLRQWHPCPTAVAAATLHGCFGALLKRYVSRMACGQLSSESLRVLHAASKLDESLLQMAAEDDPVGLGHQQQIVIDMMAPYDVDSTIFGLAKAWMDERLTMGAECVRRARDSETWNPRSKAEPYAQSAVDLMKLAKVTVDELLEIQQVPSSCREELLQRLVNGIDQLVHQYALLVASCGSKESYVPPLPPLTRCNQDSKLVQLWKMAAPPCQVGADSHLAALRLNCGGVDIATSSKQPRLVASRSRGDQGAVRPATSRGTQRLYVRLNTLHYLLAVLHSIDRALSSALRRRRARSSAFDHARPALDAAVLHVSELSAYRLVFLESAYVLHQALYQGGVPDARIRPALRVMKQSLAFLASVLSEPAQPLAVREVMKASVEAFLTAVLAGGSGRAFSRADYGAVVEDFASFKRLFCSFGVAEEVVEMEAAQAEGVLALMALSTEKLIDEFLSHYASTRTAPEDDSAQLPMAVPPTTRRWSRSDASTVLRVLCHRDDEAASRFLKKAFDLPKRR
ncbi:hypothetical protein BAE44_0011384 [Dichanthelium oligosanthes]|uniref:MHD1 domain-containing protein n=1 Tax=Dichanthelium oligosanthes TaxID=888268 RepID=A0A1E5VR63_9POAL|nr:hypothetical protein BAE44_0011384 [Dichanthelium oligosanthes]